MRKIAMILSVVWVISLMACGFASVPMETLKTGEILAVDIEGYAFYEELAIIDLGDNKVNFNINRSSPLRTDQFAKEVGKVFEEKFPAELRARGVVIDPRSPMKMKVHLAYRTSDSPGLMALMAIISFGQFEINVSTAFPLLVKKESIPFGEQRDLANAKVLAERLTEFSANGVISQLRERGEIKSGKK